MNYQKRNNQQDQETKSKRAFDVSEARKRAKKKVDSFVKRMKFNNMLRTGMSVEQAARRVGIRVPLGRRVKPEEILKKLQIESIQDEKK
jgi:hypothetical protein